MNFVVCPTLLAASRFAADINADFGYPSTEQGQKVGGGRHVASVTTVRQEFVYRRGALNEWGFPDAPEVVRARPRVPIPPGGASVPVTREEWNRVT